PPSSPVAAASLSGSVERTTSVSLITNRLPAARSERYGSALASRTANPCTCALAGSRSWRPRNSWIFSTLRWISACAFARSSLATERRSGQIARSAFTSRSETPFTVTYRSPARARSKPCPTSQPPTAIPTASSSAAMRPIGSIVVLSVHWVDQHTRVQDAGRVECGFRRAQRRRERLGALAVVPGPVVAADRVVVRDRAAVAQERLARGALDLGPLLELAATP